MGDVFSHYDITRIYARYKWVKHGKTRGMLDLGLGINIFRVHLDKWDMGP